MTGQGRSGRTTPARREAMRADDADRRSTAGATSSLARLWTALIEHRFARPGPVGLAQLGGRHLAGHLGALRVRHPEPTPSAGVWKAIPVVVAVQLAGGLLAGPLPRPLAPRLLRGDRRPAQGRGRCPPLVLFVVDLPLRWVPISVPVAAVFMAVVAMAALRYAWRLVIERRKRPERRGHGAGARVRRRRGRRAGDHRHAPRSRQPLPAGRHRRRRPAQGRSSGSGACRCAAPGPTSPRWPRTSDAEVLLIAIPSADGALIRELAQLGDEAGLKVLAVPPVTRPLRRPRRPRRHPAPHHRRPARPPRDRHRHRRHRRLPHRPAGARHRRRRLDRLRAVPPGPPLRPVASW